MLHIGGIIVIQRNRHINRYGNINVKNNINKKINKYFKFFFANLTYTK